MMRPPTPARPCHCNRMARSAVRLRYSCSTSHLSPPTRRGVRRAVSKPHTCFLIPRSFQSSMTMCANIKELASTLQSTHSRQAHGTGTTRRRGLRLLSGPCGPVASHRTTVDRDPACSCTLRRGARRLLAPCSMVVGMVHGPWRRRSLCDSLTYRYTSVQYPIV